MLTAYCNISILISIHAPTRGATVHGAKPFAGLRFQSTLPRGERHRENQVLLMYNHFNPRSHEGSDVSTCSLSTRYNNFNPRSHEGSDFTFINSSTSNIISIHAPTRGATHTYHLCCYSDRFQSTLPRGERPSGKPSAVDV